MTVTSEIQPVEHVGSRFCTADEMWTAVLTHDATADSVFLYSVRTTGIYCRPSCGARRPLRKNVRFHQSADEAESLGFRACKRCRPREVSLAQRKSGLIVRACRQIEQTGGVADLNELARDAGMSRFHFQRTFKSITGMTPRAYSTAIRARLVQDQLRHSGTVTDAIYGSGFNSSGRFYAAADTLLGMTPTAFRAGGEGMRISFAIGECSLGSILVATTHKGVCAILLGDDPEILIQDLQERFRRAELVGGDSEFEQLVAIIVGFIETPAAGLDLPLDIRGTVFQQRVWHALSEIPDGSTATYAEIAEKIGTPGASRAVAGACAANPLAVAIPCHRVVRNDGVASGYRWGIARKHALLEREAKFQRSQPVTRKRAVVIE